MIRINTIRICINCCCRTFIGNLYLEVNNIRRDSRRCINFGPQLHIMSAHIPTRSRGHIHTIVGTTARHVYVPATHSDVIIRIPQNIVVGALRDVVCDCNEGLRLGEVKEVHGSEGTCEAYVVDVGGGGKSGGYCGQEDGDVDCADIILYVQCICI